MKKSSGIYQAIAKSVLSRYIVYAINLLSMMLLARIFTPEDYGTVGAILVFYVFFQLIAEAGLGPAIINIKQLAPIDRDGIFGLTVIFGALSSLIFISSAKLFVLIYQMPEVEKVVPYVAVGLFFFSLSILPNAFLLREKAFFLISCSAIVGELTSTSISFFLFKITEPINALSSKYTIYAATQFILLWYFSKSSEFGRPYIGKNISSIKPLLSFSAYQFAFNFINFFSRNLDNVLVARYMGVVTLGVYDKAYQIMRYPLMALTFAMTPAIQPVIRAFSNDRLHVEKVHREFTFKLSLLGSAVGIFFYYYSKLIVTVILGSAWDNVIPIIKILSMSIPVQVVLSTCGSFFQAMNQAKLLFVSGLFSAVVMVVAIIYGASTLSIETLCYSLVIAFHINFMQAYFILYKYVFEISPIKFYLSILPAFLLFAFLLAFDFI